MASFSRRRTRGFGNGFGERQERKDRSKRSLKKTKEERRKAVSMLVTLVKKQGAISCQAHAAWKRKELPSNPKNPWKKRCWKRNKWVKCPPWRQREVPSTS